MTDWIKFTFNGEFVTNEMPMDGQYVELKLENGQVLDAEFTIYGSDDWWFGPPDDVEWKPEQHDAVCRAIAWRPKP